jgi:hypothetical protein
MKNIFLGEGWKFRSEKWKMGGRQDERLRISALREEYVWRLFENDVLRRQPWREEVKMEWKKLHNELHNLYSSPTVRAIKLG